MRAEKGKRLQAQVRAHAEAEPVTCTELVFALAPVLVVVLVLVPAGGKGTCTWWVTVGARRPEGPTKVPRRSREGTSEALPPFGPL